MDAECAEFAEKLHRDSRKEWARNYISFDLLLSKIGELVELSGADNVAVFNAKRYIFQGLLDAQIEQVGLLW